MTSENTTTTEPNSTYTSAVEYSSTTSALSSAAPPRRVLDQGEDEFVFHAMYAIIGAVCFIVIVIAACFVYRSKKRASANLRRVRPRSRAGVLSLELLERDLLQGGLPHPASQPLYGLESVENTELSDTSSALMRTDSNNPNTMIRNHSQENGANLNVQQLANHFQKKSECRESIRNKDKTKRNDSSRSNESTRDNGIEPTIRESKASDRPSSIESTKSKSSEIMKPKSAESPKVKSKGADRDIASLKQTLQGDSKHALKPPTSLQLKQGRFKQRTSSSSSAERQSPVVPKKPINKKRVTQGADKGSNVDEKLSSQLLPKMISVSSDYENPDDIVQLKAPTPDHSDIPIYANTEENCEISTTTGDFKSYSSTDINKTESEGFVLDINITIPPPKPCKSDSGVGYINAPKQCSPSEDDDVFVKVPGYINIPNVSKNPKDTKENKDVDEGKEYENVTKESNELCDDKEYANITKQKAPKGLPPPTSCNPIYANTQRPPQVKRGYSASCLPQETHYETSWRASDGTLPSEYVDMGKSQEENNEYIVMANKENEYLDMSGANTNSATESDANDHPHEYVNTLSDGNDEFYAVPRGNPYKTVGGNARLVVAGNLNQYKTVTGGPRCATGRSRSTDYIYDYADMNSVIKF